MKKELLTCEADFNKWNIERIKEYKEYWGYFNSTEISAPDSFPCIIVFYSDNSDFGLIQSHEYVYLADFVTKNN